jgi:hypothetical protein
MQGDIMSVKAGQAIRFDYTFCGSERFEKVEAWSSCRLLWERDLYAEAEASCLASGVVLEGRKFRVSWGGEDIHHRYRYPICRGTISVQGALIGYIEPKRKNQRLNHLKDRIDSTTGKSQITFDVTMSGEIDGIDIVCMRGHNNPSSISVTGHLTGHVEHDGHTVDDQGPAKLSFGFSATREETKRGKTVEIQRETDIFVSVKEFANLYLPVRVDGSWTMPASGTDPAAVYFVAREHNGDKIITSPMFVDYV